MFSIAAPAFASRGEIVDGWGEETTNVEEQLPKEIYISFDEEKGIRNVESIETENKMLATLTEYDKIYELANGEYIKYRNSESIVLVDKVDIDLSDRTLIESIAKSNNLQPEVLEDLLKTHDAIASNEISIGGATVFTPDTSQREVQYVGYKYYTYNGSNMMDQEIFYWDRWTGFRDIIRGSDAGNICSSISSVVIDGATYVPYVGNVISIVSSASNLSSAYQKATGSWPIAGGSSDFIQCAVTYDTYKKWSYRDVMSYTGAMSWSMGIFTEKARVSKIETIQYYANSGGRQPQTTTYPGITYKTANFDYPDYQAYIRAGSSPVWEGITYRIPGTKHKVSFD